VAKGKHGTPDGVEGTRIGKRNGGKGTTPPPIGQPKDGGKHSDTNKGK
jgi:hypothetical protein